MTSASVQAFLPLLGTDPSLTGSPGRVVNVSSTSGSYGAPFMGAYAASKHAMEGYSDSLRRELLLFGIDVVVVGEFLVSVWTPVQPAAHHHQAAGAVGPRAATDVGG